MPQDAEKMMASKKSPTAQGEHVNLTTYNAGTVGIAGFCDSDKK
jgi:hypothetical protein